MKRFEIEDRENYKETFKLLISDLIDNDISFTCYVGGLKMIIIEANSFNVELIEKVLSKYTELNIVVKIRKNYKWVKEE